MAQRRPRLGRGLETLIGPAAPDGTLSDQSRTSRHTLPVDQLEQNPFQPRRRMAPQAMDELAASIREHGLIQPIVVRPSAGRYEIITGERRWRAARQAGLTDVPVLIREASDRQMLEIALVENIQREDLNPIDRARAYDRYRKEFSLSIEALAQRIGEDRSTVSNFIRLLELPDAIKEMVAGGAISTGHARAILALPTREARCRMAQRVVSQGLSVRATEAAVRQLCRAGASPAPPEPDTDANLEDLQRRISSNLGTRVKLVPGRKKNAGRLIIHYSSLDDFDRIMDRLGVPRED